MNVEQKAKELLHEVCMVLHGVGCGPCVGSHAPMEDLHGRIAEFLAIARALEQQPEAKRDREADRQRFPDPGFNDWLDEVISDAGHIVWHQIGDLADAWAAWEARQYYGRAKATRDDELPGMWSASDFTGGRDYEQPEAQAALTEQQKADRDAVMYGTGFMLGGKHIPAQDVMIVQAPQQPEGLEAVDWKIRYTRPTLAPAPPAKVSEGYVLVPVEPTPKMLDATWNDPAEAANGGGIESHNTRNRRIYLAMLAAAQQPKEGA